MLSRKDKVKAFGIDWIKSRRDRTDAEFNLAIGVARTECQLSEEARRIQQDKAELERLCSFKSPPSPIRLVKRVADS
jgi:hypothetical protein